MTLGTADELFAELLARDATPSPEETVAFMLDVVIERAVHHPVLGVDMSRVALHAWAEALRDPEIAARIEETLPHLRRHYAQVARRWQAAGTVDPDTDPDHIGAVLLGIVHAFALQRLLIPRTDPTHYLSGVRALLAGARPPVNNATDRPGVDH
jgi:hypothetical protein